MMKTLILAIGHLKILKSKTIPAFSLLEIIVVISLISILSYFISFSVNFISSKQNFKTVNEKIKLIELELDYLQKYALSINAFINLDANNKFQNLDKIVLNKNSFHECINKSNLNNFFIFPSARTSEILISCKIKDRDYDLFINNNGIVKLNE